MSEKTKLMHLAFLDTSIIDPTKHHFEKLKSDFDLLKKYIDKSSVVLLTNEIVINEIRNHINKTVKSTLEKLESVANSRELSLVKHMRKYHSWFSPVDANDMSKDVFSEFKKVIESLSIEVLNNNDVSVDAVLKDYFDNNPPFDTADKKSEFPDAIMYHSLKKAISPDDKLHIISSDNDWESVCSKEPNYICHKNIKSFLDYLNKDDSYCEVIASFLLSENTKATINDKFREIVEGIEFTVNGGSYDRHGIYSGFEYDDSELVKITDVGYKLDTINAIDRDEDTDSAKITLLCWAELVMRCTYFDEKNSIWDSEDRRYIDMIYGANLERHSLILPIEVELSGSNEELTIKNMSVADTDLDISVLDNQTLYAREYLNEFNQDKVADRFHYERIFKCPHCKQKITIDLMSGDTECVDSSARPMGMENEYDILIEGVCEHCKKEYKVTGKLWEYPTNSYNNESDIKITQTTRDVEE